tara:strand:+ start:302 stop:1303 length:1002 start_codon:yes stop_codon:yes gene_type:complete
MTKIFNEKNLLFILSFFIIVFVFINYIHNSYDYKRVDNNKFIKLNKLEFKENLNKSLVSNESYNAVISENCEITGNMHNRHKVRWVKSYFLKNIFQFSSSLNTKLPYYINILLHSFLIFATLIFLEKTFYLKKKYILFFLLYVTFIFQGYLGEYSYSIFEMFFSSVALFASKRKNLFLFCLVTSLAVLNRESGFILIIFWLFFNLNYKQFLLSLFISAAIFLSFNYNTINCMINPKFFIPLEPQKGQINLTDLKSTSFFSLIKLLMINLIIPFGIIFYNFFKDKIKNNFYIFVVLIYLVTFLIATPIHHVAVKLIILPLIIFSFYLENKKTSI